MLEQAVLVVHEVVYVFLVYQHLAFREVRMGIALKMLLSYYGIFGHSFRKYHFLPPYNLQHDALKFLRKWHLKVHHSRDFSPTKINLVFKVEQYPKTHNQSLTCCVVIIFSFLKLNSVAQIRCDLHGVIFSISTVGLQSQRNP